MAPSESRDHPDDRRSSRSANFARLKCCCRHLACQRLLTREHAASELLVPASWLMTASTCACEFSSNHVRDIAGPQEERDLEEGLWYWEPSPEFISAGAIVLLVSSWRRGESLCQKFRRLIRKPPRDDGVGEWQSRLTKALIKK